MKIQHIHTEITEEDESRNKPAFIYWVLFQDYWWKRKIQSVLPQNVLLSLPNHLTTWSTIIKYLHAISIPRTGALIEQTSCTSYLVDYQYNQRNTSVWGRILSSRKKMAFFDQNPTSMSKCFLKKTTYVWDRRYKFCMKN